MLNRVVLVGRLTRDPELRYAKNGVAVAKFTLAVDRNYTNQQGERETDFIFISVWRGLAENCAKYTRKGSLVALEGRLQVSSYENQEGRTVWTTEVVADHVKFLDSRNSQNSDNNFGDNNMGYNNNQNQQKKQSNQDPFQSVGKPIDLSDDDLPF
ncbi:single-stranded DNA-binding protein [Shimazuella kribbensis]|uniref:single-stranded DNA-binding protein n=1 Tax=Shimazuella kribbensis TaxID=139808 RepID=UPI000409AEDA|nr:single-stranded DNA-binding protein [Shimazuella kribbensis]